MSKHLFLFLSVLLVTFHSSSAIFFPQLGFGSMNCQCQSSCNSPPSQMGCLCPPPMPCYQQPAQTYYTQPPPIIYPSYQNQRLQPQPSSSYLANIPPQFVQPYAQPAFFSTPPPLQLQQQAPSAPSLSYPSSSQLFIAEQSMKSSYSGSESPGPPSPDYSEKLNLQPPALKQKEETFDNHLSEKNYAYGADRPLSDIFYETGASDDDNEVDRNYSPITTTTENSYRNTDTTTNRNYESSTYPTSTISVTTRQESRKFDTELKRGEGNSDISNSGYGFETPSTSSPIMLEFLEHPRKYENHSQNNTDVTDVTDFTHEVDEFYKSSTSSPIQTFEYGAVRDARDSSDRETSTPKFPFDREEKIPKTSKWTSKRKIREKEDSSKCNNPTLKELMELKMTGSPSISKQMIYSAASEMWVGKNVNVICSKHSFSYVVVTSPIFCEHRKKALTCFVFFQP
ncbi:unnamed protein product [Caenorhabditis brenneri]